jgi:hypothetical protein
VHPAPEAAVEDKVVDAQEAEDRSGVRLALVKRAGEALDRHDVPQTIRLLEQSIGACPDADLLYVNDAPSRPPCAAPAHAFAIDRRAVGGTSEVVLLAVAAAVAILGIAVIRHPFVRRPETHSK